jgi:hypothetical protein
VHDSVLWTGVGGGPVVSLCDLCWDGDRSEAEFWGSGVSLRIGSIGNDAIRRRCADTSWFQCGHLTAWVGAPFGTDVGWLALRLHGESGWHDWMKVGHGIK